MAIPVQGWELKVIHLERVRGFQVGIPPMCALGKLLSPMVVKYAYLTASISLLVAPKVSSDFSFNQHASLQRQIQPERHKASEVFADIRH